MKTMKPSKSKGSWEVVTCKHTEFCFFVCDRTVFDQFKVSCADILLSLGGNMN